MQLFWTILCSVATMFIYWLIFFCFMFLFCFHFQCHFLGFWSWFINSTLITNLLDAIKQFFPLSLYIILCTQNCGHLRDNGPRLCYQSYSKVVCKLKQIQKKIHQSYKSFGNTDFSLYLCACVECQSSMNYQLCAQYCWFAFGDTPTKLHKRQIDK